MRSDLVNEQKGRGNKHKKKEKRRVRRSAFLNLEDERKGEGRKREGTKKREARVLTISAELLVNTPSVTSVLPTNFTSSSLAPSFGNSHPPVFHPSFSGLNPGAPVGGM